MICSSAESLARTISYLILGSAFCFALTACRSIDPALKPESILPGSSWRLVALDGLPVAGRSLPNIQFDKQNVVGDT
ncbi:MAG: hypothetical protein ACI87A_003231, partial [Planctomycetota bacterium]